MQHDDLIWSCIGDAKLHCSFKVKIQAKVTKLNQNFCRNEYNVTGLCNRQSCPLANSQYGTIKEENGLCYLYLKTIERAHTPKYLWEKIELPRNYTKALEVIDEHMAFWSPFNVHKCKQRLTKVHQYLIRMRKLRKKTKPKLVNVHKKVEQREARREQKALSAANLEKSIEKELLERLQKGTYGDIYNFPAKEYEAALGQVEDLENEEEEDEEEEDDELEEEEEEEEDYEPRIEFVEGPISSDEDSDLEDLGEDIEAIKAAAFKRKRGQRPTKSDRKRRKGGKVEIEYENDEEEESPLFENV